MLTREQCRAARALLDMSRARLAELAGVSERTVADFERSDRKPINATLKALASALEAAGVVFIDANGDGPGVRLKASIEEGKEE